MDINPFEFEPTEEDFALEEVVLVDDDGNPVGFDAPVQEDPEFVEITVEFVDDDCDPCPDEAYDQWADFTSGTN